MKGIKVIGKQVSFPIFSLRMKTKNRCFHSKAVFGGGICKHYRTIYLNGNLFLTTEGQTSKSFWFWFQIWHQLIFLFGFWVGTSPYPDFLLVPVSNLIIISHNAIFWDRLFSFFQIYFRIFVILLSDICLIWNLTIPSPDQTP